MDIDEGGAVMAGGRLHIDLVALVENYRLIASRVAPARAAAVVKADAYGLGAARVAPALAGVGCRDFFVAHFAEALELRPLLPADARLYVLNGLMPGTERACAHTDILPVLNSAEQAWRWREVAQALGTPRPAVLQLDSGMTRLGLEEAAAGSLASDESFRTFVPLQLIMSHLACADTPDHSANTAQVVTFESVAAMYPGVPRSFANSSGAFLPKRFHGDVVRAGIALYGGTPNQASANPMRPVVNLDGRVIQVRAVPAGIGVGYGHSFHAPFDMRIATIGIGYADGLPRALGNRGNAWFGATRLPFVGRVSMDSIMLDITELPEGTLKLGDWVELLGPHQSIDALAETADTIAYELLTSIGKRYSRSYRDPAEACQMRAA